MDFVTQATGLVCLAYHGGMKNTERAETQQKWTDGSCKIAVATVAFGMGIDLPHVRYVIHWTIAKSLEGFYQESGRGGRDGKPSLSILYYSKDDAGLFAFLVKKNAENAANKKGKQRGNASQISDHSLVELEGMVDYCTKPVCKRKFVLDHFGERNDASTYCNKTCDFCIDPKKVARDIQAADCMSAVANSQRLMHAGTKMRHQVKKFHHNPLEDEENFEGDDGFDDFFGRDEGQLGITDSAGGYELDPAPKLKGGGFVKASSVLDKYEKKECQEGKSGGFVNFKTKTFNEPVEEDPDAKKVRANIPEHLRKNAPDPLAAFNKKAADEKASGLKSSKAYASESERLKAEMAELQKQREAAKAVLMSRLSTKDSSKSTLQAPPPLSFKNRRY